MFFTSKIFKNNDTIALIITINFVKYDFIRFSNLISNKEQPNHIIKTKLNILKQLSII